MFLGEVMEVKGVKGVKGVKTYVLQLNNYAKKTVVLTPQRPKGAITPLTPLTPLTSETKH